MTAWVDAAPASKREQLAYDHVLSEREREQSGCGRLLAGATNLRIVQRDLARLAKDVCYRLAISTTTARCSGGDEREHDPRTGLDTPRARPRGDPAR
jgi:hypothetical protein